jgi:hypothetical protein
MAGWNTPARNAAINKRPCDQETRLVFGHCWQGQHRSGGCSPTDLHGGLLAVVAHGCLLRVTAVWTTLASRPV